MNTAAGIDVPQPKKRKRHLFLWLLGIFILLTLLGKLLPHPPTSDVKAPNFAPAVEKPKLPWIKASDLCSDYGSKQVQADRTYKGQRLVIKGLAGAIQKDRIETGIFAGVKPSLELNDNGGLFQVKNGVEAYFSKEDEKFLSKIKRGQPLSLVCVVLGENSATGVVEADHCRPADESEIGLPAYPNEIGKSSSQVRSHRSPSNHSSSSGSTRPWK